jgi:hypothetical protein
MDYHLSFKGFKVTQISFLISVIKKNVFVCALKKKHQLLTRVNLDSFLKICIN